MRRGVRVGQPVVLVRIRIAGGGKRRALARRTEAFHASVKAVSLGERATQAESSVTLIVLGRLAASSGTSDESKHLMVVRYSHVILDRCVYGK